MKEEFIELLKSTNRDGIDKLLAWIEKSDFYKAPASTRFHGSYEGGLLEHSLNVYKVLKQKLKQFPYADLLNIKEDTIIFNLNLPELIDKYYNANDTGIPKDIFIELLKHSFQRYNLIFNYDFLKLFEPGIKTLNVNISNPNKLNQEDIIKLFNTPEFFNQMKVVVFWFLA